MKKHILIIIFILSATFLKAQFEISFNERTQIEDLIDRYTTNLIKYSEYTKDLNIHSQSEIEKIHSRVDNSLSDNCIIFDDITNSSERGLSKSAYFRKVMENHPIFIFSQIPEYYSNNNTEWIRAIDTIYHKNYVFVRLRRTINHVNGFIYLQFLLINKVQDMQINGIYNKPPSFLKYDSYRLPIIIQPEDESVEKPEMVLVEGSSFFMGSADSHISNENPAHRVTLYSFYISKYEITVAQYRTFCNNTERQMPKEPDWGWNDKNPIVNVSWYDAVAYCNWLNKMQNVNYRLPTEAEWEYAAYGGNKGKIYLYAGSNNLNKVGWWYTISGERTNPVGSKDPNELGIYDMSGNVSEWCNDWYNEYYYDNSPNVNPNGPSAGTSRILRGGGWRNDESHCRVTCRSEASPSSKSDYVGFRIISTK